jgi:hypothetical protein
MSAHGASNPTCPVSSDVPPIPTDNSSETTLYLSNSLVPPSATPASPPPHVPTNTTSSLSHTVIPPLVPPDPTTAPLLPLTSDPHVPPSSERSWTSLFKRIPKNAGKYIPVHLSPVYEDEVMVPPSEVIDAGASIWKETLVGFFLDKPLSYTAVISKLKALWKLKGTVTVKSDGILFLFNFSCSEDKNKILQCDPIIMNNKLFIIKPYDPAISNVTGTITAVPVWVHLYNLPLYAWSPLGINWLCSHLGKMLCMDEMTEKQERLSYAKCLVEIRPHKELPDEFMVKLVEGGQQKIFVQYLWKPDVCVICKGFGHKTVCCDNKKENMYENKEENNSKENRDKVVVSVNSNKVKRNVRQTQKRNFKVWQRVGRKKVEPENKGEKEEEKKGSINEKGKNDREIKANCENEQSGDKEEINTDTREADINKNILQDDVTNTGKEGEKEVDLSELETVGDEKEKETEVELCEIESEGNLLTFNKFSVLLNMDDEDNVIEVNDESKEISEKCQEDQSKVVEKQKKIKMQYSHKEEGGNKEKYGSEEVEHTMDVTHNHEDAVHVDKGARQGHQVEERDCTQQEGKIGKKNNTKHINLSSKSHEAVNVHHACTENNTMQTNNTATQSNVTIPNPPTQHIYSKIIPPQAYKAPPPVEVPSLSTNHLSPPQPNYHLHEESTKQAVTPLSATIPNYLSTKQAVTRNMKIEILNARVAQ